MKLQRAAFIENEAERGGGIFSSGCIKHAKEIDIKNVRFERNIASQAGAAIYFTSHLLDKCELWAHAACKSLMQEDDNFTVSHTPWDVISYNPMGQLWLDNRLEEYKAQPDHYALNPVDYLPSFNVTGERNTVRDITVRNTDGTVTFQLAYGPRCATEPVEIQYGQRPPTIVANSVAFNITVLFKDLFNQTVTGLHLVYIVVLNDSMARDDSFPQIESRGRFSLCTASMFCLIFFISFL